MGCLLTLILIRILSLKIENGFSNSNPEQHKGEKLLFFGIISKTEGGGFKKQLNTSLSFVGDGRRRRIFCC